MCLISSKKWKTKCILIDHPGKLQSEPGLNLLEQIEERIATQFATREFRFLSKAVTLCNTFKGALSSTVVEEYVYNVKRSHKIQKHFLTRPHLQNGPNWFHLLK
jgi:hypothetical protein